MALDSSQAEARLKEALGECRNKNFDKGREMLETLIAEDPENYKAMNALGKVLVIMREPDTAIEWFEKAIDVRPDFSEAIINLAQTYYRLGEYPEARNLYERMVEYEPKNAGISGWPMCTGSRRNTRTRYVNTTMPLR
jgi:tetratricopeptide (TPR) repeat protein